MRKAEPFFELDSTDLSGVLPVVTIVCCITCLLTVTAKLLYQSSFLSLRHFDYALLVGTLLVVVQSVIAVRIAHLGLGKHEADIDVGNLDKIRKLQYASSLLGITVFVCTKVSLCLLVRSINSYGRVSTATSALIALVIACFISNFAAVALQCPLPTPWLATNGQTCRAIYPIHIYSLTSSFLTDAAICFLSVAMVWNIQTELKRKTLVVLLFSSRMLCAAFMIPAMMRSSSLYNGEGTDFTWRSLDHMVWLEISLHLSVITACIPGMKGLFESMLGNTMGLKIDTSYEMDPAARSNGLTIITVKNDLSKLSSSRSSQHKGSPNPAVPNIQFTNFKAGQPGSSSLDTGERSLCIHEASESMNHNDGQRESICELIEHASHVQQEVGEHQSRPSTRNSQGSI
ncbi:hypothetical protein KVR01_009196 [Diaporthe batatas]|uniref:uncharacterized protein n=1 Tax=Diaporthe batatas TaxID=748121 RepID=UPI001D044F64|nr:uncharacterized protein KVR01_009196 [Diaporthe batatas]KAG8160932.1 hypothetical protein KVR01_009196 [Diaporthe batatas]